MAVTLLLLLLVVDVLVGVLSVRAAEVLVVCKSGALYVGGRVQLFRAGVIDVSRGFVDCEMLDIVDSVVDVVGFFLHVRKKENLILLLPCEWDVCWFFSWLCLVSNSFAGKSFSWFCLSKGRAQRGRRRDLRSGVAPSRRQ